MAKPKHNNFLSDDIVLFHILPRLPARSIGRFMSVCKQWHSFLTTPEFTKMHLHHVNSENHHKLLVLSIAWPCKYFCTIDCETPEDGLTAIRRSLPFEANFHEISIISSSLNGLVCIGINRSFLSIEYNFSSIILWNPLTGEYKTMSQGNSSGIYARGFGLYYSSCDDDYKLLRVTKSSDTYIYSWKSESWRKAKSSVDPFLKFWCLDASSILLNEKLYFLAKEDTQRSSSRGRSWLIIRFDTKTEMFTEIATPFSKCFNLMVVRGCIHLCVIPKGHRDILELWKMDGNGEWAKVVRFFNLEWGHQPWHLMKNGNWLMHYLHNACVYELDPGMRKEAKEVWRCNIDGMMTILLGGNFVETIVSLKR